MHNIDHPVRRRLLNEDEIKSGTTAWVFDGKLWNGKDVGDNSQFWQKATILEITWHGYPNRIERCATVKFHHDGRISKGHFTFCMRATTE